MRIQLLSLTAFPVSTRLTSSVGCTQKVRFGTTGTPQVRVATHDREGAASQTLILTVLSLPENPFPHIKSSGVYSREQLGNAQIRGDRAVTSGNTIDLRDTGCGPVVSAPPPQRCSGRAEAENPSGETLTYSWKLHVTTHTGESVLHSTDRSAASSFPLYPHENAILVTNTCRISVTVHALDSNSLTVWSGKGIYYSTRIA